MIGRTTPTGHTPGLGLSATVASKASTADLNFNSMSSMRASLARSCFEPRFPKGTRFPVSRGTGLRHPGSIKKKIMFIYISFEKKN